MEPFDLDLLQEGGWSDVLWSLKRYAPDGYKFAVKRTPHEIKSDVLNSRRVQHAIQKVIMISVLIMTITNYDFCTNFLYILHCHSCFTWGRPEN